MRRFPTCSKSYLHAESPPRLASQGTRPCGVVTFFRALHLIIVALTSGSVHSEAFWRTAYPGDEEIVARVVAGDTSLFEVLMRRHNTRLYRTVRSIVKDETEVEDVMQQTYVAAFGSLRQFAGTAKFSTWLMRIAINEALGRRRRALQLVPDEEAEEKEPEGPMKVVSESADPEEQASRRELASLLELAIDRLPESFRTVVMLREIEGLSTAEAADVLGVSEELVKTRLHRAKRQMRESLIQEFDAQSAKAFPFYAPRCDRVVAAVFARIQATGIHSIVPPQGVDDET